MNTKTVQIPFDGFYCSFIDIEIDSVIDWHLDWKLGGIERDECPDYSIDFEGLAKYYADLYTTYVLDEYGITLELKFEELTRPREYNFETDKIYCSIDVSYLWGLYHSFTLLPNAQDLINARFSSRDGFASFYDEFCECWRVKPLLDWDVNELSILLPLVEDYCTLYEDADSNGDITNAINFAPE